MPPCVANMVDAYTGVTAVNDIPTPGATPTRCVFHVDVRPQESVAVYARGDISGDGLDFVDSWVMRQRKRLERRRSALMLADVWDEADA